MNLPDGVLQPFELRFYADDLHVMAFFGWVRGTIDRHPDGFTLRPTTPDWAIARPVHVTFARHDAMHVVTTTIGSPS
jgi:hypothetical protein